MRNMSYLHQSTGHRVNTLAAVHHYLYVAIKIDLPRSDLPNSGPKGIPFVCARMCLFVCIVPVIARVEDTLSANICSDDTTGDYVIILGGSQIWRIVFDSIG